MSRKPAGATPPPARGANVLDFPLGRHVLANPRQVRLRQADARKAATRPQPSPEPTLGTVSHNIILSRLYTRTGWLWAAQVQGRDEVTLHADLELALAALLNLLAGEVDEGGTPPAM